MTEWSQILSGDHLCWYFNISETFCPTIIRDWCGRWCNC